MIMKNVQHKILTGTVLLMSAFLLGGCASSSTTSTTSHKTTSAKVVKKNHKTTNKERNNNSEATASSKAMSNSASQKENVATAQSTTQLTSAVSSKTGTNNNAAINQKGSAVAPSQKSYVNTNKKSTYVLDNFFAASGVQHHEGDQYIVSNKGNGQYQVEIRNTGKNQDQNISNLSGLYNYNTTNNQVHKMNPVTGQFE